MEKESAGRLRGNVPAEVMVVTANRRMPRIREPYRLQSHILAIFVRAYLNSAGAVRFQIAERPNATRAGLGRQLLARPAARRAEGQESPSHLADSPHASRAEVAVALLAMFGGQHGWVMEAVRRAIRLEGGLIHFRQGAGRNGDPYRRQVQAQLHRPYAQGLSRCQKPLANRLVIDEGAIG